MDASPSSSSGSAPRRHLKRLSLSVSPRDLSRTGAIAINSDDTTASPLTATPDKRFITTGKLPDGSQSAGLPSLSRSAGPSGSSGAGSSSVGRRARPTSMYAASSFSPLNAVSPSASLAESIGSPSPLGRTALPSLPEDGDAQDTESFSPTSSLSRAGAGSIGRRSILGRSAHTRGQSSISYARSNGSDSNPSTPRSSIVLNRATDVATTPASTSSQKSEYFPRHDVVASQEMAPASSASSINEMNSGMIGAKSADLLTFIAKKERRCMDLREELKKHEEELALLKKKWEAVIQREMQAAQAAASPVTQASSSSAAFSSPSSTLSPLPATQGLFSSLTSSLGASAASPAGTSPSPKPPSASARRLLTTRHSISVASPSKAGNAARTGFLGGADLSKEDSGSSTEASSVPEDGTAYDVSKMARSWLGGMVKSASSVLETLAVPPPASNDLDTVREEEEPEEEDGVSTSRTSAGHPSAAHHDRKGSAATLGNETSSSIGSGSPSSSCEEGRFSTSTSRSSSVSSMHSDAALQTGKPGEDITPVATPVLETAQTPKGASSSAEAEDLWGLSGFEDDGAREAREKRERERIDVAHTSPPRSVAAVRSSPAQISKPASHGRRRSTAFELGGAWGSIVGKKWNEVANSEVLKKSTRATMNFVDTFEKTLTEAMTIEGSPRQDGSHSGSANITVLNGDYHPWMDHSPPASAAQSPAERERGLPSGIGGAASWTALLSGGKHKDTPKMRAEQRLSPSLNASKQSSLLDEQDEDEARDTFAPLPLPPKQQQVDSPQARLQASRAKHSKRMSLPSNILVGEQRKPSFGLGLDNLKEDEEKAEAEDGWGW